jgi:hypothetical protein
MKRALTIFFQITWLLAIAWLLYLVVGLLFGCVSSQTVKPSSVDLSTTHTYLWVPPTMDEMNWSWEHGQEPQGHYVLQTETNTGHSQSASASAVGKEITQTVNTQPPEIQFPGGGGTRGGNTSTTAKLFSGTPVIPVLFGLGALGLVGVGIYSIRIGHIRDAVIAFGSAAVCVAIAIFPEAIAVAGLLVAALALVWFLNKKGYFQSLESTRAATEALIDGTSRDKAEILMKQASTIPSDMAIFHDIVRKDNL